MAVQIPFGLKGHLLISVDKVDQGLSCGCTCPACGGLLIAKKGRKQVHHFAHYRNTECKGALETVLHLKAKEILFQSRSIVLPPVFLHRQTTPLYRARLIHFDKAQLEQGMNGVVPDVILIAGSKQIIVEVMVSHGTDIRKLKKLRGLGIPAIEVNVIQMYNNIAEQGKLLTSALFEKKLIHEVRYKSWLFNTKKEGMEYRLRKSAATKKVVCRYYKRYRNYYVSDCPLRCRSGQSHLYRTFYYANVLQDCAACSRCLEVRYSRKWVGFREVVEEPVEVVCWGHLDLPKVGSWSAPI
jgi:hypothetical protein